MKQRNISMEWLRISSMFLIILLHSIDHSTLYNSLIPGTALYYIELYMYSLVQVCVNCFVLISGYFLVKSKFKAQKLIQLWVEVVFYSLAIKLILMLTGEIPFSAVSLASCFLPIVTGRYWFVTIYFGLYLISPFLNIGISALSKKQHLNLCLILTILFSGLISIHPAFKGMNSGAGWGLAWFVVLYIIAAYLRNHYVTQTSQWLHFGIFFAIPLIITLALMICSKLPNVFMTIVENQRRYDSLPSLIASVSLMKAFIIIDNKKQSSTEKTKSKLGIKAITMLSSATFGVYLIHAHANVCIPEFWKALGIPTLSNNWWFPLYQLGLTAAIFIACALIDLVRQQLFKVVRVNKIIDIAYNSCKNVFFKLQGAKNEQS